MTRAIAFILLSLCVTSAAIAAPDADLWQRWTAHEPGSKETIDHSAFDRFLDKYVVAHEHGPNGVRYGAVSKADRKALADYIDTMEDIEIDRYNRAVQRAYWINLYNAATLNLVLDNYPVDSIKDIGGGLFSSGPWNDGIVSVEGARLTLNDIEHRILRPIWHDGLTHYGVNCASISCPDLRPGAYTGANVATNLRANARDYINSPQGVSIDDGALRVSKIYQWYGQDFGGSDQAIISHLRQYANPDLSARLDRLDGIDGYAYNWALNDQADMGDSS